MNSKLKWLTFILIAISSLSASAQTKVCLDPEVAQFFRDAYYKGQRDSLLLKTSAQREKDYVYADSIKRQQIASYKRDSVNNLATIGNLALQKRTSIDSVKQVSTTKLNKVRKRSGVKTWVIISLVGILVIEKL